MKHDKASREATEGLTTARCGRKRGAGGKGQHVRIAGNARTYCQPRGGGRAAVSGSGQEACASHSPGVSLEGSRDNAGVGAEDLFPCLLTF